MTKTKIPRGVEKLLPFRGTVSWFLPDELEPLQFQHPPVKARGYRRKSAEPAQAKPDRPEVGNKDLDEVESTSA